MKLETYDAPHIRYNETTRVVMGDAILTMLIIYGMAVYYYGYRAVALLLVSVAVAVVTGTLCVLAVGNVPNPRDLSAVVTGMILPLIMPVTIEYWVLAIAAAFAILVAKHPFGGTGNNVFNPAAAGFAFVTICFGDKIFTYPTPTPGEWIPVIGEITSIPGVSPAFTLGLGGIPKYDLGDMVFGNFPGPMGATNILVILACLLYLVSRNTIRWVTPLCFFVAAAGFAFLFPRIGDGIGMTTTLRFYSIAYEFMSGILLFGGVFLLGDPVTTPKRGWSKAAFAISTGVAVMLFRRYGKLEEGLPFAVLLMNATVWGFDMVGERVASAIRRKRFEAIGGKSIQKKA